MYKSDEEIVEEFDKIIFPVLDGGIESNFSNSPFGKWAEKELEAIKHNDKDYVELKSFILNLRHSDKEAIREEIIEWAEKEKRFWDKESEAITVLEYLLDYLKQLK